MNGASLSRRWRSRFVYSQRHRGALAAVPAGLEPSSARPAAQKRMDGAVLDSNTSWFGQRSWLLRQPEVAPSAPGSSAHSLTVLTFNTLAPTYAQHFSNKLYKDVPAAFL